MTDPKGLAPASYWETALTTNEILLWEGRPVNGIRRIKPKHRQPRGLGMVTILGGALMAIVLVLGSAEVFLLSLPVIIGIQGGIVMLLLAFRYLRSFRITAEIGTSYAVTNKRAIKLTKGIAGHSAIFTLLENVSISHDDGEPGDITVTGNAAADRIVARLSKSEATFTNIRNAAEVARLIQDVVDRNPHVTPMPGTRQIKPL